MEAITDKKWVAKLAQYSLLCVPILLFGLFFFSYCKKHQPKDLKKLLLQDILHSKGNKEKDIYDEKTIVIKKERFFLKVMLCSLRGKVNTVFFSLHAMSFVRNNSVKFWIKFK